jgi:hypothetical protein
VTKNQAIKVLGRRSTRVAATRGRRSKAFIKTEIEAVYALAKAGYDLDGLASKAGLEPDDLRQAIKLDATIGQAYEAGRADLRQALVAAQVEIALDKTSPRATQAFNNVMAALGYVDAKGKGGTSVSVEVRNELQVAAPMDGRRFRAIMAKLNDGLPDKTGETIDVRPGPPVDVDPVKAALGIEKT